MLFYIYKICCDNCEYIYVGSTRAFRQRKSQHKYDCNNEKGKKYNIAIYKTIRENGGWNNWRMVCIDEIEVENKRQAEMKEEEWRVKLQSNLNIRKAYITEEEKGGYYKQNSCKILEQMKEYRKKNKDIVRHTQNKYYEKNKDKIAEYHKEYYKEYYAKNKDTIAERGKEKIICECGCEIRKYDLTRHMKSIKHKNIIENK